LCFETPPLPVRQQLKMQGHGKACTPVSPSFSNSPVVDETKAERPTATAPTAGSKKSLSVPIPTSLAAAVGQARCLRAKVRLDKVDRSP